MEQRNTATEPTLAHETWYNADDADGFTVAIMDAIDEVSDSDPEELPPLSTAINTDCLEEIFRPLGEGDFGSIGQLQFRYHGHLISVHSTGQIRIFG